MITKHLILISCIILISGIANGQNLCSPGSQMQSIVSGRGSTIATHMPSIVYNSNTNQFTVSVFNNNEIISATQCSNLNGPQFNNPGTSTFSISLTCDGPENNGLGVSGGIAIPISNSTQSLTSVVIATGNTYSNIPVKLTNNALLANRNCQMTLQGTLYQILADNFCYPCVNFPIATVQIATGPPGFSGHCCWTCLTCYSDNNILWTSAFMWIWIDLGTALVVGGACLVWFSFAKQARWNTLMAKFMHTNGHKIPKSGTIDPKDYEATFRSFKKPGSKLMRPTPSQLSSEAVPSFPVAAAAGKKKSPTPIQPKKAPFSKTHMMSDDQQYAGPSQHGDYSLLPSEGAKYADSSHPTTKRPSSFHNRSKYDFTRT